MYRFCIILAVLVVTSSSTLARNVHKAGRESSSHSNEHGCNDQQNADSNEGFQETTTLPTTVSNSDDNSATTKTTTASSTTAKLAYRKRRDVNSIAQSTKSRSSSLASEENEGSGGENDSAGRIPELIDSSDVSEVNGTGTSNASSTISLPPLDSSSNELGSGEEDRPTAASSNEVLDPKDAKIQQVDPLKKKLHNWQESVDNYLHSKVQQRRRKRRQSSWSQLFPSASGASSSGYASKGSNSVLSAAGNAVDGALKPAMELMTQGVDLLGDLYSAQLTKTNAYINTKLLSTNSSDTVAADRFRDQLKQLQTIMSDLGQQLQRVVNSFQQAQLPFLDNIMAGGVFPFNAPSSVAKGDNGKDNALYGNSKSEKSG